MANKYNWGREKLQIILLAMLNLLSWKVENNYIVITIGANQEKSQKEKDKHTVLSSFQMSQLTSGNVSSGVNQG